jgi:hypothetical protein
LVVVVTLTAVYVEVVFAIISVVDQLSVEDCHSCTLPMLPESVRSVLFVAEQTSVEPEIVPPTEAGSTVTVASLELAEGQTPFWTTARYFVVAVRLMGLQVEVILEMSPEVNQLSVEYCHFTTFPLFPVRFKVVLLTPEQTVVEVPTDPPAEAGSTVTVATLELSVKQAPLWTTARYFVVELRLVAV